MKGLIYDLITGMAIIASLYVITNVMKANQNFIAASAVADTKVEQLYMEPDSNLIASEANSYTIADVYAIFRNFVTTDSKIMEGIEIEIKFASKDGGWGYSTMSLNDITDPSAVESVDVAIRTRVNAANGNSTYAGYTFSVFKETAGSRIKYKIVQN